MIRSFVRTWEMRRKKTQEIDGETAQINKFNRFNFDGRLYRQMAYTKTEYLNAFLKVMKNMTTQTERFKKREGDSWLK